MKKAVLAFMILAIMLAFNATAVLAEKPSDFDENGKTVALVGDRGFDEWGYNRTARIFSGTGWNWCMEKVGNEAWCHSYLGAYENDKLIMKWNAEWDRGVAENWSNPPYDAWEDNEWNGMPQGGSGEIWHYKYVWVGPCGAYGTPLNNDGYCIWDQFAVIMSHGTVENQHFWDAHGTPAGYGAYP